VDPACGQVSGRTGARAGIASIYDHDKSGRDRSGSTNHKQPPERQGNHDNYGSANDNHDNYGSANDNHDNYGTAKDNHNHNNAPPRLR
jgi:hypothetical protein